MILIASKVYFRSFRAISVICEKILCWHLQKSEQKQHNNRNAEKCLNSGKSIKIATVRVNRMPRNKLFEIENQYFYCARKKRIRFTDLIKYK